MERAVDGDNVTLCEHLLEVLDTTAANLLLLLGAERLVVEVEELLAVEGLQTAEDTLADTANGNGTDNLALEIELVLGGLGDVPVATGDLLASGTEVADESEDGHDNVLGDGDDVGASDLGDGDAAVGLVGLVQVDVVRTNTGGDGDLEVLALLQAVGGEVTGVEAGMGVSFELVVALPREVVRRHLPPAIEGIGACKEDCINLRSGDNDFSVDHLLLEHTALTLLVRGSDESVSLVLEPLADTKLVLCGTEETRLLLGVLLALIECVSVLLEAVWSYL